MSHSNLPVKLADLFIKQRGAVSAALAVNEELRGWFSEQRITDAKLNAALKCNARLIEQIESLGAVADAVFNNPVQGKPAVGHSADGSSIQNHSKGDLYPVAIVGYEIDGATQHRVENLERGTVMSINFGFCPAAFSTVALAEQAYRRRTEMQLLRWVDASAHDRRIFIKVA